MSDVAQGPGWWQASDGKWYPPQPPSLGAPQYATAPPPGPPVKKGHKVLVSLLACGAILVVIVVIGAIAGGGNKSSTSNGSGAQSPSQTPASQSTPTTAQVGTSAATPAPVGTEVSPAKGWAVKVNSAQLNADATMKVLNQFNTPQPGRQFVLVNITVHNGGSTPEAAFIAMKLSLLAPTGVADTVGICGIAPDPFDQFAQLQPGAQLTGNLCFEANPANITGSVLLAEPTLTLDTNKDQRFLALG